MLQKEYNWLIKISKNKETKKNVDLIRKDQIEVLERRKIIHDKKKLSLEFGKNKIEMERRMAPSSIDMYIEIFKKEKHFDHLLFKGKSERLVIDGGANEGFYISKLKEINPMVKIIAFEPNPSCFRVLKHNVQLNKFKNIVLVNRALFSKNGKKKFYFVNEISPIGTLQRLNRRWLNKKRITACNVRCVNLNRAFQEFKIKHLDILKLDIEGAEKEVLFSITNENLSKIKKIVVEYHGLENRNSIIGFLLKNNFDLLKEVPETESCGDLYFINRFSI